MADKTRKMDQEDMPNKQHPQEDEHMRKKGENEPQKKEKNWEEKKK